MRKQHRLLVPTCFVVVDLKITIFFFNFILLFYYLPLFLFALLTTMMIEQLFLYSFKICFGFSNFPYFKLLFYFEILLYFSDLTLSLFSPLCLVYSSSFFCCLKLKPEERERRKK